ncbi:hypothetical protein GCM10027271_42630 [Saccharopolyspora gloriosae]|uniref:Flp pilus assembly protein TadG n=1 Tax=Saccharopolyspora gloriosae TaxID=455344 RepID=A0A840NHD3_9PSEU|nr:TadE/TadG family type IV pilus assembly protein [Saccharopolyspora gloriosae]MBB5070441.1 Flp pilus assembly protein TadG [Saccharopolyspora gloriosae]
MSVHTRHNYSDRGSETVETAVLAGLALVLLVSIVQAALWWHTRSLCQHAAATGLHAARTYHSTPDAGEHAATDFLTRAPNAATDPTTNVDASAEAVTVRVSATAPRLLPIPGLEFRVTRTATAERERFTIGGRS